jgi:hypothetical protein
LHGSDILIEVGLVGQDVDLQVLLELLNLTGCNGDEPGVQVIRQVLEHTFDLRSLHLVALNLLLDRRGCQAKDHGALHGERVVRVQVMEEKVSHDEVVGMILNPWVSKS